MLGIFKEKLKALILPEIAEHIHLGHVTVNDFNNNPRWLTRSYPTCQAFDKPIANREKTKTAVRHGFTPRFASPGGKPSSSFIPLAYFAPPNAGGIANSSE